MTFTNLKKPVMLFLVGTFLQLSSQPLLAKHYKLFVLTGQSNSLGVTNGGEADPTSGYDAADDKVIFAWHNVVSASQSLGHSGQTLTPAKTTADFTSYKDQQGGVYAGSATHWGPETEFIRTLKRAGVEDFGVIKVSRGGGGNEHWDKASGGHMYTEIVDTVTEATASLTAAGHTYSIVGLLYLQGESNNTTTANIADTRFKNLIDNLRTDLPNASTMHGVIGGIAAGGAAHRDTTRARHASIATSSAYIDFFSTLDQQTSLHDGLHYNRAAKIIVGNRFAQAFLNTTVVDRHYGNLVFMGDSITQGGNGDHPSYRYQIFKNLATQGVPINATAGYKFVGSLNGGYNNSSLTTPDVNGQVFENNHDGHFGWRAFWINGRIALPTNRRSSNRGEGTIENWTGQASPQEYVTSGGTKDFPDLTTSGTGVASPYTAYTPDTASILIGINDIAGGSPATTVRDDIGTMIDQLQAANPNIRIFINQTLHSNQSYNATVDALNALLPALAQSKTTATSCVWVIEANTGFDPVTQTYDNVHPNASGEEYVGNRIAGGMGIIAMPQPAIANNPPPVIEKIGTSFTTYFEGNEIYDGTNYINGWNEDGGATASEALVNDSTDLEHDHSGQSAGVNVNGTSSTKDGGTTTWSSGNDGNWTFEARVKFIECSSGYIFWLGTGTKRILLEVYADRTQDFGAEGFNVAHDNEDGLFHIYRVAHDAANGKYHVWRDGERLTAVAGADYDTTGADERLLMGDYTGGGFGNNYKVEIDYVAYDQTGAFLPTGADADNDGLPDSWEYLYFDDVVSGGAATDTDGDGKTNEQEYEADTNPTDKESVLKIGSISELTAGNFTIVVPDTSPQRNYTLYRSLTMENAASWIAVSPATIGTDGDLSFVHSPGAEEKYFYRIEVTIP